MPTPSATMTFDTFIVQARRNGDACARVRNAVRGCAQGRATGSILLLGAAASGKSHLLAAASAALAPFLGNLLVAHGGADFVDSCDAAHYTRDADGLRRLVNRGLDLPALRRRWARARAILIDDLDRVAEHPAAAYELCRLLAASRSGGSLLLLAARHSPEVHPTWPHVAVRALAGCPRVRLAPVEPGPIGLPRQARVAAALAARGLTLSASALSEVAGLPLPPEDLAGLAADLWGRPDLDEAGRLIHLRAAYAACRAAHLRAARPEPGAVVAAAAEEYCVTPAAMYGPSRRAPVALARQVAMYLLVTDCGLGPTAAGTVVGRDHSTVLHGRDHVVALLAVDHELVHRVAAIRARAGSAARTP